MALVGRRLPDNTMPQEPGDYALFHNQPRPGIREGVADELFIIEPNGTTAALIPEKHTWAFDGDKVTVNPSILLEHGSMFHGFLTEGIWR